jgi:mannose-6-phosphate isomerase-like protein (cupin superfamily)
MAQLIIHFRDGDVVVRAGEMFVIPKGAEHKTSAAAECKALLVEKIGTVNAGEVFSDKTAPAGRSRAIDATKQS